MKGAGTYMKSLYSKKKLLIGIILIGVIIMGIFGVTALISSREINDVRSFSQGNIGEIQILMENEAVHVIRAEAGGELKFHLYGKAKTDVKLIFGNDNEKLVVNDNRGLIRPLNKLSLDIYIPEGYSKKLSIKVTSGDVKIDPANLSGFSVNSSSGEIVVKKIVAAELVLKSTSGVINVTECTAKDTKIEATSGKVNISYSQFEIGNVNIKTSSGNINVNLPGTAEFLLKAQTDSGNIQNDFAFSPGDSNDKKKIEGQIGKKGNKVTLKCASGNIAILKK